MTNQQLATLLYSLHANFEAALREAEALLPPQTKKTIKTFLGAEYIVIPALPGIQNAINELQSHADLLLTKGETP